MYLGWFFSQRDLTVCVRINQAWFDTFVPILKETVNVDDFGVVAYRKQTRPIPRKVCILTRLADMVATSSISKWKPSFLGSNSAPV